MDNPVQRKFVIRRKWLLRGVLMIISLWLVAMVMLSAAIFIYGQTDHARPADVIVVLGAGLEGDGSPSASLIRRVNHAADLWQQGLAPVVICTGGVTGKVDRSEADACGELLHARDVPQEAIILEEKSFSTEENAMYTFDMMRERGWTNAVLVSDSYHMLRGRWLFEQQGIPVFTSPVPARQMPVNEYVVAVGRELVAFNWQVFKQLLHLPFTHV
jgi:uncharacterized SAM-binding protein YcdF (DUF218 family)